MSDIIEKDDEGRQQRNRRGFISASSIIKELEEIRNNPKLWKAGGVGGQDQYAGLPPFIRNIDEIIRKLKE